MRNFFASLVFALTLILGIGFAHATSTPAPKRAYTEVLLDAKHNDPKASDIAQKVLKAEIDDAVSYSTGVVPKIYAVFVALGDGEPKTSILAGIHHPGVCGSSGCRTVMLTPTSDNKYKITFGGTLQRFFFNKREGRAKYDILATAPPRIESAFGVFMWDDASSAYKFTGLSRFAK